MSKFKFVPASGYIYVQPLKDEEDSNGFQWSKKTGDLTAVEVLNAEQYAVGDIIIVISTMIQEFEYNKDKFKICPVSAVIGHLEET